jgi:general secretion pathway protein D
MPSDFRRIRGLRDSRRRRIALFATAHLPAVCLALGLTLSASLSLAGPHPIVVGSLAGISTVGQTDPNSESERRRESDRWLQQARQAMKEGKLSQADYFIERAERTGVKSDGVFARFQDTPEKARKDLAALRASQTTGSVQPPSNRFEAAPLDVPQRNTPPRSSAPATGAEREFALDSLTDDTKAKAKSYLDRGRAALEQGDTVGATAWYQKSISLGATFGPEEYSPNQLAADLRRAGVEASRLSPAGNAAASPLQLNPGDFNSAADNQIPPVISSAVDGNRNSRFADGAINSPYEVEPYDNRSNRRFISDGQYNPATPSSYAEQLGVPPSRSPNLTGEQAARKDEAVRLMTQARKLLDRGDVNTALRLAQQAEELRVPDTAFGPDEPRPALLMLEVEKAINRRDFAVSPASNFEPANNFQPSNNFEPNNRFNPAADLPQRYPVSQGVYDPSTDRTRTVPAAAGPPTPAIGQPVVQNLNNNPGRRLYEAGIQALEQRDTQQALKHFREAWQYEGQLDPQTRQQLQDLLVQLRDVPARPLTATPAGTAPLEAIGSQQQILQEKLFREITTERSAVEKMRNSDPLDALQRLQKLRERVAQAELDPAARKQLLTLVDRSVNEMSSYVEERRPQIELDQRNREILDGIDRDRRMKVEVQGKLAELVDRFNTLIDENRYAEAEVLAKQARELDGDSEIVQSLLWKSRFARQIQQQMSMRERGQEGFLGAMGSAQESAIAFDDRQPYLFPDPKNWDELTSRRKKWLMNERHRLSPAEMEIQQSLKTKIDVRFTDRSLVEVMKQLGDLAGVNIYLDPQGLHAEGVTTDTPVTINLTQPISLKSALNLILEPLRLSYVIQNEVLRVTSEQTRDSSVYAKVYNVADLVIPIPNFLPSYSAGLPGAIQAAHRALGYGGAVPVAGAGPLTLAGDANGAGNPGMSSLAQIMGPNGMSRSNQSSGLGPGGLGGGPQADFDSLIELLTSTIAPQSWDDVGGPGSVSGFETNLSLVVSQTQDVHEQIADLLEQLRRLQDLQVTIEVRFITLNDNFFERIGIDFDFDIDDNTGLNNANPNFPDDTGPSFSFGLDAMGNPTGDLDLSFNQGSFQSAIPQFGGFDAATAANFGFAILSDIEVFFLIQASQGDQRTNILQAPKVTLFNGQSATFSDTSQTPFVTSIIPVVGDFAAAHQPVIVVLSEGTSMSVQAVISQDRRFVRLTLVPFFSKIGEVKEFTFNGKTTTNTGNAIVDPTNPNRIVKNGAQTITEGTTVQLPTFSFTTVTTTVSVPDGGTVLLGGIKRLREGRNERGVPLLSKVPYINRLFKNVGIGRETQSLMMMVTPRIIIQEEEEEKTVGRPLQ